MKQHSNPVEQLRYQSLLLDRTLTQDIHEDISLPDYQPEIKRLLRITATVQPPTRYIGGGNIEFSGNVDFNILYAGEDGALYCFPASADYMLRTLADGENALSYLSDDALTCYAAIEPDMVSGRVGGPRKLSVRCRMRARVRAWGMTQTEETWNGTLSGTPQRLRHEQSVIRVLSGSSAPLHLVDEILPDRPDTDDMRIVTAEATILPEEITTATDRILCRGQTCLKLLLQNDTAADTDATPARPTVLTRKIPFSTDIPVSGLRSDSEATVSGSCTELNLILEDGRIRCEAEIMLEGRAQQSDILSYTADLCCIGQHSEVEQIPTTVYRPLRCINANFSQNETLSAKESSLPTAGLADAAATVLPESVKISYEGKSVVVAGSCRYSLVYCSEGEPSAREIELPFRYAFDWNRPPQCQDDVDAEYSVSIVNVKARQDERDGRLNLDTELALSARLWERNSISPVGEITLGQPCTPPVGSRTIYYPLPSETLWDVAKRYCSSVERLSSVNRLQNALRADQPGSLGNARIVVI